MENLGISTDSFIGLLIFFIVNVIINLYLMNKIFAERRKNRLQKSQIKSEPEILKNHFDTQEKRTRKMVPPEKNHQTKKALNLRIAYSKIERQAIDKDINSIAYDKYISEQLTRLLKNLSANNFDPGASHLRDQLDKLEGRIKSLPFKNSNSPVKKKTLETLNKYKESLKSAKHPPKEIEKRLNKVNQLVSIFESPEKRKGFLKNQSKRKYVKESQKPIKRLNRINRESEKQIAQVETSLRKNSRHQELLDQVEHFKSENKNLQKHIKDLQNNMRTLDTSLPNENAPDLDDITEHSSELESLSEEMMDANEKEIDRLRDVIGNQRKSILEMETSLEELEKQSEGKDFDSSEHIEKLKRCIKESETCITILENEVDTLKAQLDAVSQSNDAELTENDTENFNEELQKAQEDLKESDKKLHKVEATIDFVTEMLSAHSLEDISLLIYECVSNLNCSPNIILKSSSRDLIISDTGDISVKDKVTIQNMKINEMNQGNSGQLAFRLSIISGVIRPNDPDFPPDEEASQHLTKCLKLANQSAELIIKSLDNRSRSEVGDSAVKGLKELAYKLDQMLDDQISRTQKLVGENIAQISDVARAKGVGASVISKINQIEQETVKQIVGESTVKIKTRRSLLGLLEELEKMQK